MTMGRDDAKYPQAGPIIMGMRCNRMPDLLDRDLIPFFSPFLIKSSSLLKKNKWNISVIVHF
jgi:hypothetical protein